MLQRECGRLLCGVCEFTDPTDRHSSTRDGRPPALSPAPGPVRCMAMKEPDQAESGGGGEPRSTTAHGRDGAGPWFSTAAATTEEGRTSCKPVSTRRMLCKMAATALDGKEVRASVRGRLSLPGFNLKTRKKRCRDARAGCTTEGQLGSATR